jgi:hypothetical protein
LAFYYQTGSRFAPWDSPTILVPLNEMYFGFTDSRNQWLPQALPEYDLHTVVGDLGLHTAFLRHEPHVGPMVRSSPSTISLPQWEMIARGTSSF